jgi:hypothetical protein
MKNPILPLKKVVLDQPQTNNKDQVLKRVNKSLDPEKLFSNNKLLK